MGRRSYGTLLALLALAAAVPGCQGLKDNLAVWEPMKYTPPAPGRPWRPVPDQVAMQLGDEELPGVPPDLQPLSDQLTLGDLVDVALRNNPTTRQAWEQARAAAAAWAVSRGAFYPTIQGNPSVNYADTLAGAGLFAFHGFIYQAGGTLEYLLLDFGGRSARAEAAKQGLFNANWNHDQAIQDILLDVSRSYYTYLGDNARLEADEVTLEDARTSVAAAGQRMRAGVATIADVLLAETREAQVHVDLAADRGAIKSSHGKLATAVGWPANIQFGVQARFDELPLEVVEESVKQLIAQGIASRPALAAVRATVMQREAELREAKAVRWPALNASGRYAWQDVEGSISMQGDNWTGAIELDFPIFQGLALQNAVVEAQANLDAARAALALQAQSVISEVWDSYYGFRTAAAQLEASDVLLASSGQAYDVSLGRYRAGAADIIELLDAQSNLASARAEVVQSRTSIFTSYAELVNAIGAAPRAASLSLPGESSAADRNTEDEGS